MAHLAKFGGGIEGDRMYAHWSRATDEEGNYITYSRENGGGHIDRERTKDNYTIGEIHSREWVSERLQGVYQKPGQDKPIETCDIIVTLPQSEDKSPENVRKFFESAYNSLKKQYGKYNNIVGAWIHLDEAQPHMHFAFLPISERNSKQKPEYKEKLSTRAYWPSKNSLQEMHKTLQEDIEKDMGKKIPSLYDGKTKDQGGNRTISELKKETAEQMARLERLKTKPEEMKELEGQQVKPVFGDEYYKLSPHQYKRLRTLAQNSIQEHEENVSINKKNTELEKENAELRNWVKHYIRKNKKEAEKQIRDEHEEIKGWLDDLEKEREGLFAKIDEMSLNAAGAEKMKKFIQAKGLEADFKNFKEKSHTSRSRGHR